MKENVIQNINRSLKSIGRSKNKSNLDAHRAIQLAMAPLSHETNRSREVRRYMYIYIQIKSHIYI